VPPEGVWTTCRHMQSPRELQQLNNWSVNAEIRITARQSSVENDRKTNTHLSIGLLNLVVEFGSLSARD